MHSDIFFLKHKCVFFLPTTGGITNWLSQRKDSSSSTKLVNAEMVGTQTPRHAHFELQTTKPFTNAQLGHALLDQRGHRIASLTLIPESDVSGSIQLLEDIV